MRFFDDLDAWIGAAPTVLSRSRGEEDLKRRLMILAKGAGWDQSFEALDQDGSGVSLRAPPSLLLAGAHGMPRALCAACFVFA